MNGLDVFEALRPATEHLDAATARRVRDRVIESYPDLDDRPHDDDASISHVVRGAPDDWVGAVAPRPRRSRPVAVVGAAAAAVVGVLAIVSVTGRTPAPSTAPAHTVALAPVEKDDVSPTIARVSAEVVSVDPLELTVGSSDLVRVGMAVTTGAGLVGKIESVSDNASTVLPVTDPRYVVPIRVVRGGTFVSSPTSGWAIQGQGAGLPLLLAFVSPEPADDVAVGDLVVTSGGSLSLAPDGIPIGHVTAVVDPDGTDKQVRFEVDPIVGSVPDMVSVLLYVPDAEPVTSIAAVPTSAPAATAKPTPYEATGQRVGDTVDSNANITGMDESGQVDPTMMPDWIAVSRDQIVIGFVRTADMAGTPLLPADLPPEHEPLIIYDDDSQPIGHFSPDGAPVLERD